MGDLSAKAVTAVMGRWEVQGGEEEARRGLGEIVRRLGRARVPDHRVLDAADRDLGELRQELERLAPAGVGAGAPIV